LYNEIQNIFTRLLIKFSGAVMRIKEFILFWDLGTVIGTWEWLILNIYLINDIYK
jgi:hypothetical protein